MVVSVTWALADAALRRPSWDHRAVDGSGDLSRRAQEMIPERCRWPPWPRHSRCLWRTPSMVVPELGVRTLWTLGVAWTVLTVAFEFLFGHFVMGHPWSRLLHDYNLLAGRVWLLVLLTTLLAPVLLGRLFPRG